MVLVMNTVKMAAAGNAVYFSHQVREQRVFFFRIGQTAHISALKFQIILRKAELFMSQLIKPSFHILTGALCYDASAVGRTGTGGTEIRRRHFLYQNRTHGWTPTAYPALLPQP